MTPTEAPDGPWSAGRIALALAAVAGLAVLLTLGDPGITSDEPIDVRVGRDYLAPRTRGRIDRLFADNKQHPPLGRLLVGLASWLGEPFEGLLGGADPYSVHAARLAPMACFAALVGAVSLATGRRYGRPAGFAAGLSILLMPRVFAHGHFATLDTALCLFWIVALLLADASLASRRPVLGMTLAGVFWGLALLTKIHAWLLPPVVLGLAIARLRPGKALAAIAAWSAVGLATFVAGWPWLWFDTLPRLRAFLGTSVERMALRVEYFGHVYLDRDVPWHYPWLYFAATVPVGLHLLGGWGVCEAWKGRRADPLPLAILGAIAMWLVVFSTGAPVYDGERLFLVAFPLWAVLVGLGFRAAWRLAAGRKLARGAIVGFLLVQGYGLVALHPFGLSYYNALVGGLPGAQRLGLELTYWGDAVDAKLLDDLAARADPGQTAALAPTLHHMQASAATNAALFDRQIVLQDQSAIDTADWIIVYRRRAYWSPEIERLVADHPPVAVRSRQGVWLSGLWRRPDRAPPKPSPANGSIPSLSN